MHPRKPCSLYLITLGVGFFFTISGIIIFCISTMIYDAIIGSNLVLQPGSTAYDMWVKNPIPMDLSLYIFNWTNSQDIHHYPAIKPRFQILGPYSYSETKEKKNITWNNNHTVTYRNKKSWIFEQERSNGSLSDLVTSVSPVALGAAYVSRYSNRFIKMGLSATMNTMGQTLASTHTVSEILFDGYDDTLLKLASTMTFLLKPNSLKMDKFAWFYGRNGSVDFEGVYNVDTGISGTLGQLKEYDYKKRTTFYPSECGAFTDSSAGDFFPSKLTKETVIKFFSSDLCRYAQLEFEKEVEIHGIVGYKFAASDMFLDNGTKIPENKCFCDGNCMPSGALNVSLCRHGSPAFVSLPHFYKADSYYLDAVEGLNPTKDKHDFFMILEPKTGLPLQVSARLQLNLQIQTIEGFILYQNLSEIYMPILYFDQTVTIPGGIAFLLKLLVNFDVICAAVACILISIGLTLCFFMCYKICKTNIFEKDKMDVKLPEEVPLNK